jgi:hypothetical protein
MGYQTDFDGQINIVPPLNEKEIAYLNNFSKSRRMDCEQGPYYVDRGGFMGQLHEDPMIRNYNQPPEGQPNLWCQWVPTEDGTAIVWDEGEKFYESDKWMKYLIEHFLGENPKAKSELSFLEGHTLNGTIEAMGEKHDDRWDLIVRDNVVMVQDYSFVPDIEKEI